MRLLGGLWRIESSAGNAGPCLWCGSPEHQQYPHRDHRPGRHSHSHARKGLSGGRPGDSQNARSRGGSISATVKRRQADGLSDARRRRSEEHTSELQSLMRISYAVFCLKKKIKQQNKHILESMSNKTIEK